MCNRVLYTMLSKSFLYYRWGGAETDSLGVFLFLNSEFQISHMFSNDTYFSASWSPAGLFDLPHNCCHQEQRQKATGTIDRKQDQAWDLRKQAREYLDWLVCFKKKKSYLYFAFMQLLSNCFKITLWMISWLNRHEYLKFPFNFKRIT